MTTRFLLLATVLATLAACGSMPDRNSALEQARGRFNSAGADPQVARLAPEELKKAGDSLRVADQSWRDGADTGKVDHLAYMTMQNVTIAQDTANSRAAQAVTTNAAAERDKARLAQRTKEADQAQQQLAVSEKSNAQKSTELAVADAAALRDKERVERRDARVRDLELQLQQLNAKKTERGMVLTLGDVLFDSGQSKLLADGSRNMVKLAEFFKRNPQNTASIEGYTDSVGSSNANLDLSGRRAQAVMAALVDLGVQADHLSIKAHGEDMPAASNDTAAGRQLNRRVEIVFAAPSDEVSMR
ncbi:OmpA family protein [Roseateles violae]|uniref:OmpA family protein n=1 Tax=Roseateles violae TaxID=3058042 RepID=A0ABT8E099_9BURK|nr:OmpA family protein [Pelomonas sp. PFR6]MDN3923267.1 OmpA family protein [Pelomonas sp. PFR6]